MVKLIGENGSAIRTSYKGGLANYFLKGRDNKYLNVEKSMEAIYRRWILWKNYGSFQEYFLIYRRRRSF